MKIEKGQAGYIKAQKNKLLAQSFISFGIVIAIFLLGYLQTGTRLNWLTFIAVLGCLPAAKVLVGLIAIAPYKTIDSGKAAEISSKAPLLTIACDMVITSRDKIMPVDAVVISGNTVCGYASNSKTNPEEAARHIKDILNENRIFKVTVKIFSDYASFLARAEGMNSIAEIERTDTKSKEKKIKGIILNISM